MSYKEFGQRLTAARHARALSRYDVAVALSVAPSFYARVERGLSLVSLITLALLWRCLGFDADELLATLPAHAAEPDKRQRERKRPRLAELASPLSGFEDILIRARKNAGLTQKQLAKAVGLSRGQIGRIECGHGLPSVPTFARMHRVLDFNANSALDRLLGGSGPIERYYGFGNAIKTARLRLRLRQPVVAGRARCSIERYRRIERGAILPTMKEAACIHRVLDFDASAALRWLWESGVADRMS